jgi:hypothetical protein
MPALAAMSEELSKLFIVAKNKMAEENLVKNKNQLLRRSRT